ncbi:PKD domain-containing protein [Babesia caballi]|uniref:PKD domain-containing protein n=1 Tax=Babesia caballi TaxID=5871 RepID=A0AAV4LX66_BABCB|nr:PKD domain-containing protein [Babesia caballi]
MDMPEEITELRSGGQAHQPVEHLSDRGRWTGLCGLLLVLMAEIRRGTKVESGEEIVIRDSPRRLPVSETAALELLEEPGVGCGIGCAF